MPPRRHPRSWLAGRLRSAAGAVQRLAGRVEPAEPVPAQPPSDAPPASPRRFGEPPQHWLDLVAAHAPGLLHDLDLDVSPAGAPETGGRAGLPGGQGSIGPDDADGADPSSDDTSGDGADASGSAGAGGHDPDLAGPAGLPVERRTGRSSRTSRAGERSGGTAIGGLAAFDRVTAEPPNASPERAGPARPVAAGTAARAAVADAAARAARREAGGDTTVDGSGQSEPEDPPAPVRPMILGPHRHHRADAVEPTRRASGSRRSGAVVDDSDPSTGTPRLRPSAPATVDRQPADRRGFRGDQERSANGHRRGGKDQRGYAVGRRAGSRLDEETGTASYGLPDEPNRGRGHDAAAWTGPTAALTRDTTNAGRGDPTHTVEGGPWPALPDDARPAGGHPYPVGVATRDGEWGRGRTGGGAAGFEPASSGVGARVVDPWPVLPDDSTLWTVPGDALDATQLSRLDREQAGE